MPRAILKSVAEKILESFRDVPGNGSEAARRAGVNPKTTIKAWRKGLIIHGYPEYMEPFKDKIAREQVEARAIMVEEKARVARMRAEAEMQRQQAQALKALRDATDTRVEEATVIRAGRTNVTTYLSVLADMGAGVAHVANMMKQAAGALVVKGEEGVTCIVTDPISYARAKAKGKNGYEYIRPVSINDTNNYTKTVAASATALRQVLDAAQKIINMERVYLGEPTSIVAHHHLESMTMPEAEQHVDAFQKAAARFKEKGMSMEKDTSLH